MHAPDEPRAHHQRRVRECQAAGKRIDRWYTLFAWLRLASLVLLMAALYQACDERRTTGAALGSPLLVVAVSIVVARIDRAGKRVDEARAWHEAALARLDGRWAEGAPDGMAHADPEHPYAADLDLFGERSLYARLCLARTSVGRQALADWLQAPAPAAEARARQPAVAELAARVDLRERLWLAAGRVGHEVRAEGLESWVRAPAVAPSPGRRAAALLLGLASGASIFAVLSGAPAAWLLAVPPALVFASRHRALVAAVSLQGQRRTDELAAISRLLAEVERERFEAPRLIELQRLLAPEGVTARRQVARLARLVGWFESRRNPFFGLLSAPFIPGTQLALAIEAWRARHGAAVAAWLRALGELEALASLGAYAFENPALPFPEITDEGPVYEGRALAHPLLPPATRVANDVALGGDLRLLLVTGSNMSGKSTLLRTVGINAVLALAGAPVCAGALRLSPLTIGATLRTADSLQAGASRFFAEIQRLRTILAAAEQSPRVLYLIDEILSGTNSQDRAAGATAIVRALVQRGAIGLVTTHDLTLAKLADELAPAAANVHFEDVIDDGKLSFDYRLRPGVVTRGNAVALMRLVGLPV